MKLDFVSAPSRNASFPLDFPFPDRAISARNPVEHRVQLLSTVASRNYAFTILEKDSSPGLDTRLSRFKLGAVLRTVESTGEGGGRGRRGTTKALIVRVSKRHLRFNAPSFSSSFTPFPVLRTTPLPLLFASKKRPNYTFDGSRIILTVSYEQF